MTSERKTAETIVAEAMAAADEYTLVEDAVCAALRAAGLLAQEPEAVEGNAKLLQNSGPSDEQVEAAAKAMHERDLAKSEELYPSRPSMWAKLRPAYYEHARAALTAAGAPRDPERDALVADLLAENAALKADAGVTAQPVIDVAALERLARRIAHELDTDDAVADNWSNEKVMATGRRIVEFAVNPWLKDGVLTSSHSHSLHVTEGAVRASDDAVTASELEPVILAAEVAWNGRGRREPLAKALARDLAKHLQEPS